MKIPVSHELLIGIGIGLVIGGTVSISAEMVFLGVIALIVALAIYIVKVSY